MVERKPGRGGRRAQAARNDRRILEAAREVFTSDPGAPVAAVARRAGVGISALYRRYPSKEDLLRRLCHEGLRRYLAEVEAALADDRDAWAAFADFMRRAVDADTSSLTVPLAGTFTPSQELNRDAARARELSRRLFERTRAAGVIRPDVEVDDVFLLLEQLAATRLGDEGRTRELRQRYLALVLDGLRARPEVPLPGRPPRWEEIGGRWNGASSPP
ncbi:MAG TPA: TetR/AcrR family transcriptional regulator [Candidatus Dormibacteraeota bacterium]|nr:TetR/AcrR family transcriptional regulator [Candidatus Dormibacteraeota bacterium]